MRPHVVHGGCVVDLIIYPECGLPGSTPVGPAPPPGKLFFHLYWGFVGSRVAILQPQCGFGHRTAKWCTLISPNPFIYKVWCPSRGLIPYSPGTILLDITGDGDQPPMWALEGRFVSFCGVSPTRALSGPRGDFRPRSASRPLGQGHLRGPSLGRLLTRPRAIGAQDFVRNLPSPTWTAATAEN